MDVRAPADPQDSETTNAKVAQPPDDFRVTAAATYNLISITDRYAVSGRAATSAYRVYFLASSVATSSTMATAANRQAALRMASLVTTISAPGRGTVLTATDAVNSGKKGYYYCTSINQQGYESPCENVVPAP